MGWRDLKKKTQRCAEMSICPTTGKTQYANDKDAAAGLEKMKKHRPEYEGEPYFCMYCSNYHFGKKQEKKKKASK